MSLRVIRAGFLSTLQDGGRWGFQSQGVPVGGAMDRDAMTQANLLVGNAATAVVIEMVLHGAEFRVEADVLIALAGGGAVALVDGVPLAFNKPIGLRRGAVLKFLPASFGRFAYLAVAGGMDVPAVMNSCATYLPSGFGGFEGRALKRGDCIQVREGGRGAGEKIWRGLRWKGAVGEAPWSGASFQKLDMPKVVRVVAGPEWTWFTDASRNRLFEAEFRPTADSNRMGYRLTGPVFERVRHDELISTAVGAGTVQCLPNGSLIVLMADSQTTGGYPRIAQVAAVDLPCCAQLQTQEPVLFKPISWTDAETLLLKRERWFQRLKRSLDSQIRGI